MSLYETIVNPVTNRKVRIDRPGGRRILQHYLNMTYQEGGGGVEGVEERLDDGEPFPFFSSIAEADDDGQFGKEFSLGEMPRHAFITYDGNVYQIIIHDNETGYMVCSQPSNNSIVRIDASENAVYWGSDNPNT